MVVINFHEKTDESYCLRTLGIFSLNVYLFPLEINVSANGRTPTRIPYNN